MLTARQERFVTEYLECWNASEAARRAGYSDKTAGAIGWENLRKPEIEDAIAQRISDRGIKTQEVLLRLTAMARADIGDFFSTGDDGRPRIDLERAREAKRLGLIRRLHVGSDGAITIELHDAQAALTILGKALGILRENVNLSAGELVVTTRIARVSGERNIAEGVQGGAALGNGQG